MRVAGGGGGVGGGKRRWFPAAERIHQHRSLEGRQGEGGEEGPPVRDPTIIHESFRPQTLLFLVGFDRAWIDKKESRREGWMARHQGAMDGEELDTAAPVFLSGDYLFSFFFFVAPLHFILFHLIFV